MTGLVLKDFLVLRKALRTYVLFLIFYLILAIVGLFSISFITAFVQIIVMILPMSSFAYDDLAKWDRYAMTLPLGRRAVVRAKYAFVLLMILVAAAFALLSCVALSITAAQPVEENLAAGVGALSVGLLAVDVTLPLNYKMGPERARPFHTPSSSSPSSSSCWPPARAGWISWSSFPSLWSCPCWVLFPWSFCWACRCPTSSPAALWNKRSFK